MLINFFDRLREFRIPVSVRELLDCLAVLREGLAYADLDQFYFLSRMVLVKDEKYFDRFDLAFNAFFEGLGNVEDVFEDYNNVELLEEVLARHFPRMSDNQLSSLLAEYRQQVEQKKQAGKKPGLSMDDDQAKPGQSTSRQDDSVPNRPDKSCDLDEREDGQSSRADEGDSGDSGDADNGESGTGDGGEAGEGDNGESGEGDQGESGDGDNGEKGEGEDGKEGEGTNGEKGVGSGDHPGQGIRDDLDSVSQRSASKVWQLRQFEELDPEVELGTRNIKMALRRLRKFARTAPDYELDIEDTIRSTAKNGGLLEIKEVPERHNSVKVLLFLDIGGSMDDHIALCAQLFSAARSEFKYLEYYYFHNFIYESVWKDNERRTEEKVKTFDLIHRFGRDYKIIFVGDASMARHEVAERGGSVEHFNAEPGEIWLSRIQNHFKKIVWLNPVDVHKWQDSYTIQMIDRLMEKQMYHLSVEGIDKAMKYLVR